MAKRKSRKKKFQLKKWMIVGVVLSVIAGFCYYYYYTIDISKAKFTRYPAFGIDIPENYAIHGIDVSRYQNYIDWHSVKQMKVEDVKINFAFIKATEGVGNVDKMFKRNWKNAGKAGVTRGAYHFFIATKSGKLQANNFIKNVHLKPGDLPPVLDIEHLYGVKPDKLRKEIKDWLQIVEAHYKVKPIIYTYVSFYSSYLSGKFDAYPLWAAHYFERDKPRIKRKWIFWQHNERGRVNGITHPVDFNVFNGDTAEFNALPIK